MGNMIYTISSSFSHYLRSTTVYQEHSPFFFDLWKNVLIGGMDKSLEKNLLEARHRSEHNTTRIERTDLGRRDDGIRYPSTISEVARHSLTPHWKSRILHLLVKHYHMNSILELGSSLGLSSAYMACQEFPVKVTTLEGDPVLCNLATKLHNELDLPNIEVVCGPFHETLDDTLRQGPLIQLAFIDGHHNGEALLENFNKILDHLDTGAIVIIDDVYWSNEMTQTWRHIRSLDRVTASMAYYDLGILFFEVLWPYKPELEWVDRWLKPWTILHSM